MEQTLLLNATWEPLKVVDWQKALTLWCQGKVEVVASYDREVRSVSLSFRLPSVIRLLRRIRIRRAIDDVPFSRANIYARDACTCQYCGVRFPAADLTFDHVIPVAQGGRKTWDNIVAACVQCNRRKGGRTPEQAGMALIRTPKRPSKAPAVRLTIGLRHTPDSWRDYLYWNVTLDETRGTGRARCPTAPPAANGGMRTSRPTFLRDIPAYLVRRRRRARGVAVRG